MKLKQGEIKKLLRKKDRRRIEKIIRKSSDVREVKRALVLRMLDQDYSAVAIEGVVCSCEKTVRNIRDRYEQNGLNAALHDKVRSGQPKIFTSKKVQRITAIACSAPPEGYSRWTLDLLREHVVKNGVVDQVSREGIRIILRDHDLKPWQKKMWCIPEINQEYIDRMEDVLEIYEKPYNKKEPVVCLDEKPFQLLDNIRTPTAMKPGKSARQDYEYKRYGSVNVFRAIEPKAGKHFTKVTPNRKMPEFAQFLKEIENAYSKARKIHLVMDNLSTHSENAVALTFGEEEGRRLWSRFTVHYTPKHASWLNQAEIGIGIYARQCLGKDRIGTIEELTKRSEAWNLEANKKRIKIDWGFTRKKARKKFNYKTGKN
jgi:hypothetical protein